MPDAVQSDVIKLDAFLSSNDEVKEEAVDQPFGMATDTLELKRHYAGKAESEINAEEFGQAISKLSDELSNLDDKQYSAFKLSEDDELGSFMQSYDVNFGDDAKKLWLDIIGQLQSDFDDQASNKKDKSYVLSDENGKTLLQKIFKLTTLHSSDDEDNLKPVQQAANALINDILEHKTKGFTTAGTVNEVSRAYIVDMLGAANDKDLLKSILGLVDREGIGPFCKSNSKFLKKVKNSFGKGIIGEQVAELVKNKVNSLLMKPPSEQMRRALEESDLTDKYSDIKESFFRNLEETILEKADKVTANWKNDDDRSIVTERIGLIRKVYLAKDEEEAAEHMKELTASYIKVRENIDANKGEQRLASLTESKVKSALGSKRTLPVAISSGLIGDNAKLKAAWVYSIYQNAKSIIESAGQGLSPQDISKADIIAYLNTLPKSGDGIAIPADGADNPEIVLSNKEAKTLEGIAGTDQADDTSTSIIVAGTKLTYSDVYNRLVNLKLKAENELRSTQLELAEKQVDRIEDTAKEVNAGANGSSINQWLEARIKGNELISPDDEARINKSLEGEHTWYLSVNKDSPKGCIDRVAAGLVLDLTKQIKKDTTARAKELEKVAREANKLIFIPAIEKAQSVAWTLGFALRDNLKSEGEDAVSDNLKDAFSDYSQRKLDEIKAELELDSSTELKDAAEQNYYTAIQKLDANSQASLKGNNNQSVEDLLNTLIDGDGNYQEKLNAVIRALDDASFASRFATFAFSKNDKEKYVNADIDGLTYSELAAKRSTQKALILEKLDILKQYKSKIKPDSDAAQILAKVETSLPNKRAIKDYLSDLRALERDFGSKVEELNKKQEEKEAIENADEIWDAGEENSTIAKESNNMVRDVFRDMITSLGSSRSKFAKVFGDDVKDLDTDDTQGTYQQSLRLFLQTAGDMSQTAAAA